VTLAEMARARGKAAGAVTTTRLTHATPAATYAHAALREWEGDADMPAAARAAGCADIARQLVEAPARTRLNVAMGGGRSRFTPVASGGKRADGRDLTREWAQGPRAAYVADAAALAALRPGRMDHVLGLFDAEHLPDVEDRPSTVPSLADMTTKAIDLLSADRDGYFLMVEGGKIDHLNHANQARGALAETVDFAEAVKAALAKVDLRDTLVIVTADHSHGLTISGYAARGTPILGLAGGEAGAGQGGRWQGLHHARLRHGPRRSQGRGAPP
jgi:alkaline phosphatase